VAVHGAQVVISLGGLPVVSPYYQKETLDWVKVSLFTPNSGIFSFSAAASEMRLAAVVLVASLLLAAGRAANDVRERKMKLIKKFLKKKVAEGQVRLVEGQDKFQGA